MGSASSASDESSIEATIRRVAEARAAADSDAGGESSSLESADISDEADAAHQERRIDALVQRVAASKAARIGVPPDDAVEPAFRRMAGPPEDAIEATIRRVAEAKAAREAAAANEPSPEPELPSSTADSANPEPSFGIEASEPAPSGAASSEPPDEVDDAVQPAAPEALDSPLRSVSPSREPDDRIEATIRRVAEANAAREAAVDDEPSGKTEAPSSGNHSADPEPSLDVELPELTPTGLRVSQPADDADDAPEPAAPTPFDSPPRPFRTLPEPDDPIEATIRRVAAAKAAQAAAPATNNQTPHVDASDDCSDQDAVQPGAERVIKPAAWREPLRANADETQGSEEFSRSVAELRRDLDETRQALASLTARFDAPKAAPRAELPLAPSASDDEDWDDAPSLPRIPLGQPPRPPIFRDPPPVTDVAAQPIASAPEELVIDTRPIPKPLPPLHAEPRRGLDLLPRSYRVTVEDKRRGVDLVPLHRALLGMDGVRDMSLLSYSNGVAIVSLDTVDQLDPDALCDAISRAMSRPARVEVHNEQTMVVKLAEE